MQNVHHMLQKADEAVYANGLAEVHAQAIDGIFAILDDESFLILPIGLAVYKRAGLQTSGSTIGTVATTEQSARSGRNSANTTTLNDLKTTLAATRAKQEAAADRLYRNSEQGAWNGYLNGMQTAKTIYIGSIKTAENTYKTAADVADTTYRAASITAYVGYQNATNDLCALYSTAVARAGDTNFNLAAFFTATGGNTACQAYEFTRRENAGENEIAGIPSSPSLSPETEVAVNAGFEQAWKNMSRNTSSEIVTGELKNTVTPLHEVDVIDSLFSSWPLPSSLNCDLEAEAVYCAIRNPPLVSIFGLYTP